MADPANTSGQTPRERPRDPYPDADEGVRVRTHPALCAGMGNCHRWAPEVYPLDEDGMIAVHMLAVPPELAEQAWRGASVCPEGAITVIGPPEVYWVTRRKEAAEAAAEDRSDPRS